MSRWLAVEARGHPGLLVRITFPLVCVLGAGAIGAVLLLVAGHDPVEAYARVTLASFGSSLALVRTLITATPLILTAMAAAVAFRMRLWNIGGEGQLYLGAIAASGTALALGAGVSPVVAIVLSLLAAVIFGGLWGFLAAVPRAYFRTDEVITTLMLNFIALHLVNYLIFGSVSFWRDAERLSFPTGRLIPEVAQLPRIWLRLDVGLLVAVAVALLIWWLLRSSHWGLNIRVIGQSSAAARYAGMNVTFQIIAVLVASGALAGLAGGLLVTGSVHALQPASITTGLGYTGIVVAAVCRLNALAIVPVAVVIAGLTNAGSALQTLGIPAEIVLLLQGLALLLVAAGEFFLHNRVRLARPRLAAEAA